MRKSTVLWLLLAVFCSATLFHTSQRVHDEREKIEALQKSAAAEEESIRVLEAEWSYLNQPGRLEKLAQQHLKLAPLKGSQFVAPNDISAGVPVAAIKINPPVPAVVTAPENTDAPAPEVASKRTTTGAERTIGDVIKSLGVNR